MDVRTLQSKRILVIDDDINLCQSIKIDFSRAGAEIFTATDGQSGLKLFYQHHPDLIILDIRMPVLNGWDVCKHIRQVASTPIIMLTSVNQESDVVRGLHYGADDFVLKPFSRDVLAARVLAVLRRAEQSNKAEHEPRTAYYRDDYLTVDLQSRQVEVRQQPVRLTATEFRLLAYLIENAGQTLPYQTILIQVWGWEYQNDVDYVHVYMSHLRRKLEEDPRSPRYLLNEHGVGYRFARQD
jgi:two-component system KDP operon response regulator KdpE